jgi:hypothetical protein
MGGEWAGLWLCTEEGPPWPTGHRGSRASAEFRLPCLREQKGEEGEWLENSRQGY